MKIKDLKTALDQYDDDDLVFLKLGIGTAHRVDTCQIKYASSDPDLYEIKSAEKAEGIEALVLNIE